jgi:hypothetical protein
MAHHDVRLKSVLLVFLILVVASSGWTLTRKGRERTLEELTKESDSVVIGVCKSKKAEFVGKIIETDYEIEVSERLKGKGKGGPKETIVITVPGGELTTPPISQAVSHAPIMFLGEEVALFLKDTAPAAPTQQAAEKRNPKSKLWTSPQVVGWAEGKFSVVTDKKSGKKRIARVVPEEYGWVNHDEAIRRAISSVASGDANLVEGDVVEISAGLYTTPEGKSVLDKITAGIAHAEDHEKEHAPKGAAAKANAPGKQQSYGPVIVQDFDDFKAKVRSFVK